MSCGSPAVFCGVLRLSDGPSMIGLLDVSPTLSDRE